MLAQLLAAALLLGALDPVEVATRHELAGRPELALHLLDAITQGKGDAAAEAVRARLKAKLGRTATPAQMVDNRVPAPKPSASAKPAVPHEDPMPLFAAKQYLRAAPLFRTNLEANPHDFPTFSYLTNCYWSQAEQLAAEGNKPEAAKVYDEGLRVEAMYAPNFADELQGSTAPEGLAHRVGR